MAAKAAIKDVGRVLNIPLARVEQINKLIPQRLNITLEDALKEEPALRKLAEDDPEVGKLLDFARRLEGTQPQRRHPRRRRRHRRPAARGPRPAPEAPQQGQGPRGRHHPVGHGRRREGRPAEDGLPRPAQPHHAGRRPSGSSTPATRDEPLDLDDLPLDDPKTFELFQRGETKGVFQFESAGIRDLLIKMRPDRFTDIIATNALYRPGPLNGGMVDEYVNVKNGRKKAVYLHPVLKEVLEETYGVMVYQEQVMRILNRLGGIELSERYATIKAISKKKTDDHRPGPRPVHQGRRRARRWRRTGAVKIFDLIVFFGGYGFNKSHSHRLRPRRLPDGLPQGPLSRPSTWPRCSPTRWTARSGTSSSSSISTTAGGWASRCCRPNINEGQLAFQVAERGADPLRPRRDQGGGIQGRRGDRQGADGEGAVRQPRRLLRAGLDQGGRRRLRRDADPRRRLRLPRARAGRSSWRSCRGPSRPARPSRRTGSAASSASSTCSRPRRPRPDGNGNGQWQRERQRPRAA